MKIVNKVYTYWVVFWFALTFLLMYPLYLLVLITPRTYFMGHYLNKVWGYSLFTYGGMPWKIEYQCKKLPKKPYLICANHSSYIDIPSLALAFPGYFAFVGKSSLAKVPLFGYMFRKLYIPIDRKSRSSRYESIKKAGKMLDKKIPVAFFPEGTIPPTAPEMIPFKEGAFRLAIEKQIPVIPVTIPYNWIILQDRKKKTPVMKRHMMKVIVHEPISTKGMTQDDMAELKDQTFNIINSELQKQLKDENR